MRPPHILDGFFTANRREVEAALSALPDVSRGPVLRPALYRWPERHIPEDGGLHCARLFGPTREGLCLCGWVADRYRERTGQTCPKCGVDAVSTSVRHERWAHIELGAPLEHPLVPGLEVTRLPVCPPGDRPLIHVRGEPSDYNDVLFERHGAWQPAAVDSALAALVLRNQRLGRLVELGAPDIITDHHRTVTAQAFDTAVRLMALPLDAPERHRVATAWQPVPSDTPDHLDGEAAEPLAPLTLGGQPPINLDEPWEGPVQPHKPRGLAWLDARTVVVQMGHALFTVDVESGALGRPWPATHLTLRGVVGSRVLLADRPERGMPDEEAGVPEGQLWGLALVDPKSGVWAVGPLPDDLPRIFVGKDQPEDQWLYDLITGDEAPPDYDISGDRGDEITRSPDHRFLWLSSALGDGAVMDTHTGRTHFKLSPLELGDQNHHKRSDEEDCAVAIARTPWGAWRILDAWGGISHDGRLRGLAPFAPCAAAFSADGDQLAVADKKRLTICGLMYYGMARPRITFDLTALGDCLRGGKTPGLAGASKKSLLATFGTIEAARSADPHGLDKLGLSKKQRAALLALPPMPWPARLEPA